MFISRRQALAGVTAAVIAWFMPTRKWPQTSGDYVFSHMRTLTMAGVTHRCAVYAAVKLDTVISIMDDHFVVHQPLKAVFVEDKFCLLENHSIHKFPRAILAGQRVLCRNIETGGLRYLVT